MDTDRIAATGELSAVIVDFRTRPEPFAERFRAMLGWKQPQVARLERGDHMPSLSTLQRLARHGVLPFDIVEGPHLQVVQNHPAVPA